MYYKQHKGELLIQKSTEMPKWVKWVHHVTGLMHCAECLMLDGCWFLFEKAPVWPHHEKCHCSLEAIDYLVVLMNATAKSDYSKFDHTCLIPWESIFMERINFLLSGDIQQMMQDGYRQRISILIEIPRRNQDGMVSFASGWMVKPDGELKLNTPYGGK